MKIKISTLLMEAAVSYNKQKLHKAGYFRELLATNPDIDEGLRSLLRQGNLVRRVEGLWHKQRHNRAARHTPAFLSD